MLAFECLSTSLQVKNLRRQRPISLKNINRSVYTVEDPFPTKEGIMTPKKLIQESSLKTKLQEPAGRDLQ